jgi:hypothetical protein
LFLCMLAPCPCPLSFLLRVNRTAVYCCFPPTWALSTRRTLPQLGGCPRPFGLRVASAMEKIRRYFMSWFKGDAHLLSNRPCGRLLNIYTRAYLQTACPAFALKHACMGLYIKCNCYVKTILLFHRLLSS